MKNILSSLFMLLGRAPEFNIQEVESLALAFNIYEIKIQYPIQKGKLKIKYDNICLRFYKDNQIL